MNSVAIVDYGMCNLDSIARAVDECGGQPLVTGDPAALRVVNRIILPGVGAFGDGARNVRERGLDQALTEQVIGQKIPFLGICLGMQLMAKRGTEHGRHDGLGWIDGGVVKLERSEKRERVPHIGWNEVRYARPSALFDGIGDSTDFYFVHSYHLQCSDPEDIIATTPYCGGFASAVRRENMLGVQFHPEKSQKAGFRLLHNFLAL